MIGSDMPLTRPCLIGRRSSVFTRLPLLFAETLALEYDFTPVGDMTLTAPEAYAGNPALKLPILRIGDETVFGAANICRVLAEQAAASGNRARIVWPEELADTLSRNAQELVWHAMAAQVQLVMGTVIGKLPAEAGFFTKIRLGLEGSLAWLDAHADALIERLPAPRTLSLLEASLFCLVEHLAFRPTVPIAGCGALTRFARRYGESAAARATAHRFD